MSKILGQLRVLANLLLDFRYVVAISSALFFIVLGIAFYLVYQNAGIMGAEISDNFNQQQLILARQAASQIRADLDDILVEVNGLRQYLERMPAQVRGEAIEAVLERTRSKGLVEIGLMNSAGRVLEDRRAPGVQRTEPARVAVACRGQETGAMILGPLWAGPPGDGRSAVAGIFCTPIFLGNSEEPIKLFATLDVSQLGSRAAQDIRSGKTGYAWVIDNHGLFLYHPERGFIGLNAFEARQQRAPYISFSQINRIMKERMLLGEEGTGSYVSGWHRGFHGQITKLIAFTPVRSPALARGRLWSVAVCAPVSEVAGPVHRVYLRHFATEAALIAAMFVFGLSWGINERRLSQALEKRMGQQEEYMSSILQNSIDAIMFVDNENRVQVWNRGAELIFGYRAEEMVGQTLHRLIPPEIDADEELRRIREVMSTTGYVKDYVAPRVTKDGRRITIEISRTNVRSKEGEVIGSTVIIKDVTEKMQLEQRIYNTEKLASIGILAAGVAHEINNPLAIILGFTDLLLERFQPGSPEYEDLKIIAEHGDHAKKIVEDLLGFARITEGMEEVVDVNHCIERVVNIVGNTLMTAKIQLVMEVAPSLPRVRGDAREFQQVIFNLVNNSVAAMRPKGGTLTLGARARNGWVDLTVADTGCGIPDKLKQRIFDPFFTTKKAGEGTGLGLSLCYGITNKYGGRISLTSVAAEDCPRGPTGTKFTVSMPVCDKPTPTEQE
ncbi:MAG: ATP-binding protein [Candidatus Binataceae bacterium]